VLLDSASKAGARLAIPSLAYPVGGVISGFVISRYGRLIGLVRAGALCMAAGNALVTSLGFYDKIWKYYVFIIPANIGQGIVYPAILFTNLATFEHSGMSPSTPCLEGFDLQLHRPRSISINGVPRPIYRQRLGRCYLLGYRPVHAEVQAARSVG